MSSEATPILAGAIPSFELFMTAWERLAEMHPRLAPWINAGMEYAIIYYGRMDRTRSYIIAMCKSLNRFILFAALNVAFEFLTRPSA
jgi:hypothetical protein